MKITIGGDVYGSSEKFIFINFYKSFQAEKILDWIEVYNDYFYLNL